MKPYEEFNNYYVIEQFGKYSIGDIDFGDASKVSKYLDDGAEILSQGGKYVIKYGDDFLDIPPNSNKIVANAVGMARTKNANQLAELNGQLAKIGTGTLAGSAKRSLEDSISNFKKMLEEQDSLIADLNKVDINPNKVDLPSANAVSVASSSVPRRNAVVGNAGGINLSTVKNRRSPVFNLKPEIDLNKVDTQKITENITKLDADVDSISSWASSTGKSSDKFTAIANDASTLKNSIKQLQSNIKNASPKQIREIEGQIKNLEDNINTLWKASNNFNKKNGWGFKIDGVSKYADELPADNPLKKQLTELAAKASDNPKYIRDIKKIITDNNLTDQRLGKFSEAATDAFKNNNWIKQNDFLDNITENLDGVVKNLEADPIFAESKKVTDTLTDAVEASPDIMKRNSIITTLSNSFKKFKDNLIDFKNKITIGNNWKDWKAAQKDINLKNTVDDGIGKINKNTDEIASNNNKINDNLKRIKDIDVEIKNNLGKDFNLNTKLLKEKRQLDLDNAKLFKKNISLANANSKILKDPNISKALSEANINVSDASKTLDDIVTNGEELSKADDAVTKVIDGVKDKVVKENIAKNTPPTKTLFQRVKSFNVKGFAVKNPITFKLSKGQKKWGVRVLKLGVITGIIYGGIAIAGAPCRPLEVAEDSSEINCGTFKADSCAKCPTTNAENCAGNCGESNCKGECYFEGNVCKNRNLPKDKASCDKITGATWNTETKNCDNISDTDRFDENGNLIITGSTTPTDSGSTPTPSDPSATPSDPSATPSDSDDDDVINEGLITNDTASLIKQELKKDEVARNYLNNFYISSIWELSKEDLDIELARLRAEGNENEAIIMEEFWNGYNSLSELEKAKFLKLSDEDKIAIFLSQNNFKVNNEGYIVDMTEINKQDTQVSTKDDFWKKNKNIIIWGSVGLGIFLFLIIIIVLISK